LVWSFAPLALKLRGGHPIIGAMMGVMGFGLGLVGIVGIVFGLIVIVSAIMLNIRPVST
jgi:hypothetical protein